ncbi:histone H2B.1-like [Platysternon megacephalum]|uniref:Histone H2B.1-like n=1 Tax=Platysternon megacephalum TaxID=55544 RepID=A0A4D9DQY3_9SAUR|nr:histone H2B.1-like [Platysternon megacephalum]
MRAYRPVTGSGVLRMRFPSPLLPRERQVIFPTLLAAVFSRDVVSKHRSKWRVEAPGTVLRRRYGRIAKNLLNSTLGLPFPSKNGVQDSAITF